MQYFITIISFSTILLASMAYGDCPKALTVQSALNQGLMYAQDSKSADAKAILRASTVKTNIGEFFTNNPDLTSTNDGINRFIMSIVNLVKATAKRKAQKEKTPEKHNKAYNFTFSDSLSNILEGNYKGSLDTGLHGTQTPSKRDDSINCNYQGTLPDGRTNYKLSFDIK